MIKRVPYLIILMVLLSVVLTACTRDRFRREVDSPAPVAATMAPSAATMEMVPTTATMPEQPAEVPSPTIAPGPTAQPAQSSAAATASAKLDSLLSDLETLLGEIDTDITIP